MKPMNRPLVAVFAALLMGLTGPAAALATVHPASEIHTINQTKDAWVQITAYAPTTGRSIVEGTWCVAPGRTDDHFLHVEVASVRAQVGKAECTQTSMTVHLGTDGPYYQHNYHLWTLTGYLRGSHGSYTFTK